MLLLVLAVSGCLQGTEPDPGPTPTATPTAVVSCRVTDQAGAPLPQASCRFQWPGGVDIRHVDAEGNAGAPVPVGATVTLTASAPGYASREHTFAVERAVRITIPLTRLPSSTTVTAAPTPTIAPTTPPNATPPPVGPQRRWLPPVQVTDAGNEPHIVVAPSGTIFYAPTAGLVDGLMRSRDGGRTWETVEPTVAEGLPALASDTSVSVAPDGSVWYARYWAYPGTTIGCTSSDEGASWTCDNLAIPPVTDRMWIVGLDAQTGYLQTNVGLYANTYATTTTGSLKYVPYGVSSLVVNVRNGNMVYDEVSGGVFQVMHSGTLRLLRVDAGAGIVSARDTGIPAPYALPWLSVRDGVFWTAGEAEGGDGSRRLLLARSTDTGTHWDTFSIESEARSVTFAFAAAGPDGRVAAVYYGSDRGGPSTENGGTWSLYVVESDNALDAAPVWTETKLVEEVHVGNVCVGLNCEDSGGDPDARFSGDLIGCWIDADGNVHIAYNDDTTGGALNRYVRQAWTGSAP